MTEKDYNNHIFNEDDTTLDLDIKTEIRFSRKDHPEGKMVPIFVDGKEEFILIPLNIKDGATIKLDGRGKHNHRTGKYGDLYVVVHIDDHSFPWKTVLAIAAPILILLLCSVFKFFSAPEQSPPVETHPTIAVQQTETHATTVETAAEAVPTTLPPETTAPPKVQNPLAQLQQGDLFRLGSYEQDNNFGNGTEPIEWLVLARDGDSVLAISRYALDCVPYHTTDSGVTWKSSYIRKWLNESFYNAAFTSDEKGLILTTSIVAEYNPRYDVFPGSNTEDEVFLLSIKEIEMYMTPAQKSNEENQQYTSRRRAARLCEPTAYTVAQGAYVRKDANGSWWWLRNPGEIGSNASCILSYGDILYAGEVIDSNKGTVRPAIWITVE